MLQNIIDFTKKCLPLALQPFANLIIDIIFVILFIGIIIAPEITIPALLALVIIFLLLHPKP